MAISGDFYWPPPGNPDGYQPGENHGHPQRGRRATDGPWLAVTVTAFTGAFGAAVRDVGSAVVDAGVDRSRRT